MSGIATEELSKKKLTYCTGTCIPSFFISFSTTPLRFLLQSLNLNALLQTALTCSSVSFSFIFFLIFVHFFFFFASSKINDLPLSCFYINFLHASFAMQNVANIPKTLEDHFQKKKKSMIKL